MQLLVFVLNKVEVLDKLLTELGNAQIKGATILSSTGMAMELANQEDVPFLWSLRAMLNPERAENKTIFTVLDEEQVKTAEQIIRQVVGDLSQPDTGILFTVPINYAEGLLKG